MFRKLLQSGEPVCRLQRTRGTWGDGLGRSGKTGRDSITQKVFPASPETMIFFPKSSWEPKYLVGFLWKMSTPQFSGGRLKEVVRPRRMKALYLGSESRDTGF